MIEIPTPDGPCTTEVVTPEGTGSRPAVIVFFDAAGFRPATTKLAERIAAMGYVAFVPNLFHRSPPIGELLGTPVTLAALRSVFQDAERRTKFMTGWYMPALDWGNLTKTIGAVLDHIATRSDVKGGVGTTGYCMGGNASFRAATLFGERLAVTASFHPGWLVTDQPDSPHSRAERIKARLYLGPANGDLPPENEAKLKAQLDQGGVRYTIEHYDADHGYAVEDSHAYNEAAAEKHYAALQSLLAATLG
jgi:carboxymethylenebutenolidase